MSVLLFDYLNCFPNNVVWTNRTSIHWQIHNEVSSTNWDHDYGILPEPGYDVWTKPQRDEILKWLQPVFDVTMEVDKWQLTHRKTKETLNVVLLTKETNYSGCIWEYRTQRCRSRRFASRTCGKIKLLEPRGFLRRKH